MNVSLENSSVLIATPEPGIRLLTINRPERRNALDRAAYGALGKGIVDADGDDSIRVTILTGQGAHFTSGNDLQDFQTQAAGEPTAGLAFLRQLHGARKPIVAAVEGYAVGIGTTMLLHCDLAYAASDARFRLPFAQLGLCPEGASSYLLPLVAGSKKAAELLMLGDVFGGAEALACGLVNGVTEPGGALAAALISARRLATLPAASIAVTKQLLKRAPDAAIAEAFTVEAAAFAERRRSPEAQAAFAAFFKR
jgi:enoyl-CoA hydratase/carnithine racemase